MLETVYSFFLETEVFGHFIFIVARLTDNKRKLTPKMLNFNNSHLELLFLV